MKDIEPKTNLEIKFAATKDELVKQINETYIDQSKDYSNVVIRVATNEWSGGSQALVLGSDGKWAGKFDMSGYEIGKNPSIDDLLFEYASIKDKDYQTLQAFKDETEEEEVLAEYIKKYRDRLLGELIGEMEERIKELK